VASFGGSWTFIIPFQSAMTVWMVYSGHWRQPMPVPPAFCSRLNSWYGQVDEYGERQLKVLFFQNQQPVETFRSDGAHDPLGNTVGLRNFSSRSRIRNRIGSERSARIHDRCRACWTTQGALGFGVQPARCTRRLPR